MTHSLLALTLLFAATSAFAEPTSTQRFIVALTDELEAKVIGDDELVALIESADAGRVANPICEATAELSTARLLAHQSFQQYVDAGDLDAIAVADWARENLVASERGRARREENRNDTMLPWKVEPTVLAAGMTHSCAIKVDGNLTCWGLNHVGQCDVKADLGAVQSVSVGNHFTCVIVADGTVKCWGENFAGQVDVPENLGPVQMLAAGMNHVCAVRAEGSVKCWGDNEVNQVDAPRGFESVPKLLCAGSGHSCALLTDGTVKCWGNDFYKATVVPEEGLSARILSCNGHHTCVVQDDELVTCWGEDGDVVALDFGPVRSVSSGNHITCALKVDGTVKCWGHYVYSALDVPADLGSVQLLSAGGNHVCVVLMNGTVRCWGEKTNGVLEAPEGLIVKNNRSKP